MTNEEELVAHVVGSAADGELVGRVRLQKVFYLLEQLGLESGFSFAYHHYGPFSADLVDAVDGAKAFGYVVETQNRRQSDGMPFGVFRLGDRAPEAQSSVGALDRKDVEAALTCMNSRSSTVLELAATIHWIRAKLGISDWRQELSERKGRKADNGRTEEALELLSELGLSFN